MNYLKLVTECLKIIYRCMADLSINYVRTKVHTMFSTIFKQNIINSPKL